MFSSTKNKKFNYQPRFSNKKDNESVGKEFVSKWKQDKIANKKFKPVLSIKVLIILLVLLLIGMYYLDSFINN